MIWYIPFIVEQRKAIKQNVYNFLRFGDHGDGFSDRRASSKASRLGMPSSWLVVFSKGTFALCRSSSCEEPIAMQIRMEMDIE
jgi:hypothetical protein